MLASCFHETEKKTAVKEVVACLEKRERERESVVGCEADVGVGGLCYHDAEQLPGR